MATPVTLPGVYDVIFKQANGFDPTITWRQTYTFASTSTPIIGAGLLEALATYVNATTRSDSKNVEIALYNWARGRQPYPTGDAIALDVISVTGSADTHWPHLDAIYDPGPGEVCLRVDHTPAVGSRAGRSFIRGLLGEGDITSMTGGGMVLTAGTTAIQGDLTALLTTSALSSYFGIGTGGQKMVIVRYSPTTNIVHGYTDVNGFQVVGVTTNKRQRSNRH